MKGRTLTITRIDGDGGWDDDFFLRAYLPTEVIPDFASTVYTCWGLRREEAPLDTTKVIFHLSVTTIQNMAFDGCYCLLRVTIPDTVTRIESDALNYCESLKSIRLSTNLEYIGDHAFNGCESLQAAFIPPTVTYIGDDAFCDCTSLRFLYVPETIDHLGQNVFLRCDQLSTTVSNYLSKVCYNTVNPQMIQECIQTHGTELTTKVDDHQKTALHIICANPHVTEDCIRAYLQLGPEAANQEDSDGMTPFQYLCRNDITHTLLDDMSFSSLMIWWYHCMPPQTETGKKRKRE